MDFFEDKEEKEQNESQSQEKIKLGDREFSQDELDKLVGLGEKAVELESKWNTKIDRLYPEFTKKTQRLAEIEQELEKVKSNPEPAPQTGDMTPEQEELVRKNLMRILGGKPLTDKEFDTYYLERRNAEKLLEDSNAVVMEAKELGKPQTSVEDLLQHMKETGIKNPAKAYKDMFEGELDQWKEAQLKKVKPQGLTTQSSSSAGSKQPNPIRPNRNNLGELLSASLENIV